MSLIPLSRSIEIRWPILVQSQFLYCFIAFFHFLFYQIIDFVMLRAKKFTSCHKCLHRNSKFKQIERICLRPIEIITKIINVPVSYCMIPDH
jgi:hypothetical protein